MTPPPVASPGPPLRFSIDPGDQAALVITPTVVDVAIAPDGSRIVYNGLARGTTAPQLFVRVLDELSTVPLRGGEGGVAQFFSADGESVGFVDGRAIWRVPVTGGIPSLVARVEQIRGASWGDDNTIVFATAGGGLSSAPAYGGQPVPLTVPDGESTDGGHFWPDVLPGSEAVLFTHSIGAASEQNEMFVLDLETGAQRSLGSGSRPRYVASGHIVYVNDGTLWTAPFDVSSLDVTGDAVPVLDGVMTKDNGAGNFAVADTPTRARR